MPRIWNLRQVPLGLGKFSSGLDGVKLQHHEGIKSRRDVYMSHYLFCYFCYFFFFSLKFKAIGCTQLVLLAHVVYLSCVFFVGT